LRTRAIQELVFSVANTDFEGGDNDNGYGDYIFLVKHGQPKNYKEIEVEVNPSTLGRVNFSGKKGPTQP
jgi:hypothetical protein